MGIKHTIHAAWARARAALVCAALLAASPSHAAAADFGSFTSADVLLVVAPHPDDESLCCAGAIARAQAAGARVALMWITSGDAFEFDAHVVERRLLTHHEDLIALAQLRMQEAAKVAALFDVAPGERFFLGYPDGGVKYLLHENFDTPYRSPHTGAAAVPYAQAFAQGAAYTGRNLTRDLNAVIEHVQPTWILAPALLDQHPDHSATGALIMRVTANTPRAARVRYWIVHGGFEWPWPRGLHAERALVPPHVARDLPWATFDLLPAERTLKTDAIRLYETQLRVMASFLLSFVKRNEIYSTEPVPKQADTPKNTALPAINGKTAPHAVIPY